MKQHAFKFTWLWLAVVLLLLLPSISLWAQERVYEPPVGSTERKAIMDALRKPVERDLNRPVLFQVPPPSDFRVQRGWAFLTARLRKPDGAPMDFRGTRYAANREFRSDSVNALLHRTQGHWHVVTFVLCPTDVEWGTWRRKYHAPPAIFPPTH